MNTSCNQTFIWVQENFMRLSRTSVSGIILTVNQSTFILPGNLFKILNIGLILRIIAGNHFKLFYPFSLQNKDQVYSNNKTQQVPYSIFRIFTLGCARRPDLFPAAFGAGWGAVSRGCGSPHVQVPPRGYHILHTRVSVSYDQAHTVYMYVLE